MQDWKWGNYHAGKAKFGSPRSQPQVDGDFPHSRRCQAVGSFALALGSEESFLCDMAFRYSVLAPIAGIAARIEPTGKDDHDGNEGEVEDEGGRGT